MSRYICDADQPYSRIELELTEYQNGAYTAAMNIIRNDEHGEPISIAMLASKYSVEYLLPQGEMPALRRAMRELGREKTKNILLDFLEHGGATELREARDKVNGELWEEIAKFYLWVNDYLNDVLFGGDSNK